MAVSLLKSIYRAFLLYKNKYKDNRMSPDSNKYLKFAANQTPVQIDVFMPPVRKRMNGKKTI